MTTPQRSLSAVTLLVPDYDQGLAYYCDVLGFTLIEDTPLSETKRWVLVSPSGTKDFCLLLAKADGPAQNNAIGAQTGDRVFLFLNTDDFERDYRDYRKSGVKFLEEPRHEPYGSVCVFQDPFGNKWDLIERKE